MSVLSHSNSNQQKNIYLVCWTGNISVTTENGHEKSPVDCKHKWNFYWFRSFCVSPGGLCIPCAPVWALPAALMDSRDITGDLRTPEPLCWGQGQPLAVKSHSDLLGGNFCTLWTGSQWNRLPRQVHQLISLWRSLGPNKLQPWALRSDPIAGPAWAGTLGGPWSQGYSVTLSVSPALLPISLSCWQKLLLWADLHPGEAA